MSRSFFLLQFSIFYLHFYTFLSYHISFIIFYALDTLFLISLIHNDDLCLHISILFSFTTDTFHLSLFYSIGSNVIISSLYTSSVGWVLSSPRFLSLIFTLLFFSPLPSLLSSSMHLLFSCQVYYTHKHRVIDTIWRRALSIQSLPQIVFTLHHLHTQLKTIPFFHSYLSLFSSSSSLKYPLYPFLFLLSLTLLISSLQPLSSSLPCLYTIPATLIFLCFPPHLSYILHLSWTSSLTVLLLTLLKAAKSWGTVAALELPRHILPKSVPTAWGAVWWDRVFLPSDWYIWVSAGSGLPAGQGFGTCADRCSTVHSPHGLGSACCGQLPSMTHWSLQPEIKFA